MIRSCEWHGTQAVEFTKRDYTALLVPSVGANLVRLAHTRLGVEVLRTPSEREHDEFLRRPHVYGVPILFPPNRIADGRFRFDGREYRFPITRPEENNYHHGILKIGNLCRDCLADVQCRGVQQAVQRTELCQNIAGCFVAVHLPMCQVVNVRDGFCCQEAIKLPIGTEQKNRLRIFAERLTALQGVHHDAGINDSSHIRFSLSSFASSNVTSAGRIPNRDLAMSTLS